MSSGCGDVLSLQDLKTAKLHQLFEAEVITGKAGGVASGQDIDYATNAVTGQTQKTMPAILRDTGFRPANFSFTSGGTLSTGDSDVAVLWPQPDGGDGGYYIWKGALPKVIPANSSPASTGGISDGAWMPLGDVSVRKDLASTDNNLGDSLVAVKSLLPGGASRTQHDKNADYLSVQDFTSPDAALASGFNIHFKSGTYNFTSAASVPQGVTLYIDDGVVFTGALVTVLGEIKAPSRYLSGIPYPQGFVVTLNGNSYIAVTQTYGVNPENDDGSRWRLTESNNELNLAVPSRFSTVAKVLSFISGATLNAKLTVKFSSGTYTVGTISPMVRNGNNLFFSGVSSDRGLVVLNTGTGDGFVCGAGQSFSITDLTVTSTNWTSHGSWTGVSNGVFASNGGRIYCKNVFVNKCYYGFQAALGGVIDADGCESAEAGDGGFFAFNGGHINAINCPSHDHYDSGFIGVLGFGYVAEAGGTMWVRNATVYGSVGGVFANIGASIRCDSLNSYGNGNGVIVKAGSTVETNSSTINSNISDNVYVLGGSCYNSNGTTHSSSQQGAGILLRGNSSATLNSCSTNSNTTYGVICDLLSSAKLNSSHTSTGNGSGAYSPAFSTSGNKNSWIDN